MQKQNYLVTNDQGQFFTKAGHETWSADVALAHKYDSADEARAIANLENAFVVPENS